VITKSDQLVEELQVDPPGVLSDHSLISWCMPIQRQPPIVHHCEVRSWSKVDRDEFRAALLSSDLCSIDQRPSTAAGYFDLYHDVLQSLVDQFAPVRKTTKQRQRLAPWMDEECRRLRRQSRRLERISGEPNRLLIDKHGLNMSECGIGSTVKKSVPTGLQKSRCNLVNRRSCGALSKVSWEATSLTNYEEAVHMLNSS